MKTIRNLTRKHLKISIGDGKILRLGPMRDGTLADKAVDAASVLRLVEAGSIEVLDGDSAGHGPLAGRK